MSAKSAYLPYGFFMHDRGVLAFNGEPFNPVTGCYLLGNGYRAFSPPLMRFNSPDSLSPFDRGGLNAYAYCQGDPVNYQDPSGHRLWGVLAAALKGPKPAKATTTIARDRLFTKVVGWHGTSRKELASLSKGLSAGHSESHRQAQGEGFYVAPTFEHAKKYADVHNDGIVLTVIVREDVSLTPSIGYRKDVFDVVVIKAPAFGMVRVREDVPSAATPARLPRTGIFARK